MNIGSDPLLFGPTENGAAAPAAAPYSHLTR